MKRYVVVLGLLLLVAGGITAVFISFLYVTPANHVEAAVTVGVFYDSGQNLGFSTSQAVALADLNGDKILDAFVANTTANQVWLNNGAAQFSANGQSLGSLNSHDVALGHLDGDTDVDAFVANSNGPDQVWLNNGSGQFSDSGQSLSSGVSYSVALGDLDGDTDLDAFVSSSISNTVWINNGSGIFSDSGQSLGSSNSYDVALGDLDGDKDLDAFVGNGLSGAQPDTVWLNDGNGNFSDSGQSLGAAWTYAVALGDLDGDKDLDAFTASWFPNANKVFWNDGNGNFTDSGQNLGTAASIGVTLADVDDDNDLDAVVANNTPDGTQIWLNNGSGQFTLNQTLGNGTSYDVALADLDGDNDPDAFAANFGANKVWLNGVPGLPNAIYDVDQPVNDDGDDTSYWTATGNALLPILLSQPAGQNLDTHSRIEMMNGSVMTQTVSFTVGEQVKYLNLVNPAPNPSEAVTLTLSVTPAGISPGPGDVTDRLVLVFVDDAQGMQECILCYVEWLALLVGKSSTFTALHHANLPDQQESPLWNYYRGLFDYHSPEMAGIMAKNPSLLWTAASTLDEWTAPIQSLEPGSGMTMTVTQQMADDMDDLLDGIQAEAGPSLQATIQHEQDAVDLPSFAGMDMQSAWTELEQKRPISELFITVVLNSD